MLTTGGPDSGTLVSQALGRAHGPVSPWQNGAQPGLARVGRIMRGDPAKTRSEVVPSERPTVLMVGEALAHENPGGLNRYLEDLASALEVAGHACLHNPDGHGPHQISEPRSGGQDVLATAFADSVVLEGSRTTGRPYRCGRLPFRALRTASCPRDAPPFEALGRPLPRAVGRGVSGRGPAERRDSVGQALDGGRSLPTRYQTRHPLRGFQGHLGRALPRGSFSRGGDPPGRRPGPLPPRRQITDPTASGALRRRLRSRGGTPP